jgi:hypothetical protein
MAVFSPVFSCIFLFFLQTRETRRARPQARARNEKPGAACRPDSWRSFGEYALLEDSRYTSQAENRAAIKSLNQQRKSALPVGRNKRSALRQSMARVHPPREIKAALLWSRQSVEHAFDSSVIRLVRKHGLISSQQQSSK